MSTVAHQFSSQPATSFQPGARPGGLPLTIRFTETEYAALLRIAANRSTTASHLIEALVRHALTHSVVPPIADALDRDSGEKAGSASSTPTAGRNPTSPARGTGEGGGAR